MNISHASRQLPAYCWYFVKAKVSERRIRQLDIKSYRERIAEACAQRRRNNLMQLENKVGFRRDSCHDIIKNGSQRDAARRALRE